MVVGFERREALQVLHSVPLSRSHALLDKPPYHTCQRSIHTGYLNHKHSAKADLAMQKSP